LHLVGFYSPVITTMHGPVNIKYGIITWHHYKRVSVAQEGEFIFTTS